MKRTGAVIIGGGQAGLAMSRCLCDRSVEHVVLERGRIGERWRSERWDSLRLLTPNWLSRLPGWSYRGTDPDGFMTMPEVIDYLQGYAQSFRAPVEELTNVLSVVPDGDGYRITTDQGAWWSKNLVIATGHCDTPYVPPIARKLANDIIQLVPTRYRSPDHLPEGAVLVVGASASGIQMAEEIHASGRPVTVAVGRHTRLPRRYRGRDILWWLELMGLLDQTPADVYDFEISREQPSLQLVGRPDHGTLDLPMLQRQGVRLTGRLLDLQGHAVRFADDLVGYTAAADAKLAVLLRRIDNFIAKKGLDDEVDEPAPFVPFLWPSPWPEEINLQTEGIRTVVWATGFRRRYPWLKVPVLDDRGEIVHRGGITAAPGLYVIGLQFLRHRKSAFIDGVGRDAAELAEHMCRPSFRRGEEMECLT